MLEMKIQRVLPHGDIIIECDGVKAYYIGHTVTGAISRFRQEHNLQHKKIAKSQLPDRETKLRNNSCLDTIVIGGRGYVVGEIQGTKEMGEGKH